MKELKWYNYVAKALMIGITIPIFPLLLIMSLAAGGGPFDIYKTMWDDRSPLL